MCSNGLKLDARMKKYQVLTGCMKWDREMMLRRHQRRVKNVKPAIDNKTPDRGPFITLNTKKMWQQEDKVNKIEYKNRLILKRLRSIHEVKLPEFCHRKRRARTKGDAYWPKPATGGKDFRYDWQALRGSTARCSLRKQEIILRRLLTSKNVTPDEAKKLKAYLPKPMEVPTEYIEYGKREQKSVEGVPASESVRYAEDAEPEEILTKLAAIRLHMHYGNYVPGSDSPYLDTHTKHKRQM